MFFIDHDGSRWYIGGMATEHAETVTAALNALLELMKDHPSRSSSTDNQLVDYRGVGWYHLVPHLTSCSTRRLQGVAGRPAQAGISITSNPRRSRC